MAFDHAAAADADRTDKMWKLPRAFRVERVMYVNPTGLAAHAANFFTVKLTKGATVVASWSTETGEDGTIAADTFVELNLSATDADRVFAADDEMKLFLDEAAGTATLPAGRVIVEGFYL
jgi:hypothetical protein